MSYGWIDAKTLSFNSLLLMDGWIIRYISNIKDAEFHQKLAIALAANPVVKWYFTTKCSDCREYFESLVRSVSSDVSPEYIRECEIYVLDFLDTFIVYLYPAIMDELPYIKSWDPRHLVTTGMVSTRHAWMQGREELRRDLYGSPHIDFITIHAYNGNEDPEAIEDDSDLARAFGKPFIIEEAGFDLRKYDNRPEKTRTDLADWFRKGASSYMPWGFVATPTDNHDGDAFVGMTAP